MRLSVRPRADAGIPARGLIPLVVALVGWQIAGDPRSVVVPPPSAWLAALARLTAAGDLLPALATTVSTYLAALATAMIAGVGLGVLIGASRRADRLLTPFLDSLASVPGAAMVPLTLLLLGFTFVANVLIVVLVAVWPVLHVTTMAMRSVPAVRLDMSRTLRLSTTARWLKVVLPSLVPDILVGMRGASSATLILTLLADILGASGGLGIQLEIRSQSFDAAGAWGLLLLIGTLGYVASRTIAGVEQRVLRSWPPADGRRSAPMP